MASLVPIELTASYQQINTNSKSFRAIVTKSINAKKISIKYAGDTPAIEDIYVDPGFKIESTEPVAVYAKGLGVFITVDEEA